MLPNNNIPCIEFGKQYAEGIVRKDYFTPSEQKIFSCFNFYLNIYGLRNDIYTKNQLTVISNCFGFATIFGMIIILIILRKAWIKYYNLKNTASKLIRQKEWKKTYTQVPLGIVRICALTLSSQLVIYTLMSVQFFTGDQFQKNHVDLLAKGADRILFKFDQLEKTVLVLVCLTNSLWLPIFQFQIWELIHLLAILDEYDE